MIRLEISTLKILNVLIRKEKILLFLCVQISHQVVTGKSEEGCDAGEQEYLTSLYL